MLTERDVILEERRSRIDNNPAALLNEQMNAALYLNDPYGVPVIGWYHEMQKLSRQDAMTFYKHYYAPNNAILVVSGDVTADEVRKLAEATYGQIPANPDISPVRQRPRRAAAARCAAPRTQRPARRQFFAAALLRHPELRHREAGRGGSARSLDEDRRLGLDQPDL